MKDITVTLTSKNQLTLPVQIVRNLHLHGQRRFSIRSRGNELILKPLPSLDEKLQELWQQLPQFQGTQSEEELQRTSNEAWALKKT